MIMVSWVCLVPQAMLWTKGFENNIGCIAQPNPSSAGSYEGHLFYNTLLGQLPSDTRRMHLGDLKN